MGAEAELMAIGSFDDDLVEHLDYGPWDYKDVKPGQRVVTTLVLCRTTDASKALAEALGVGYMELGRHVFDGLTPVQFRALMRFALVGEGKVAADCRVEAIDVLSRRGGWTFVYRPNA